MHDLLLLLASPNLAVVNSMLAVVDVLVLLVGVFTSRTDTFKRGGSR